MFVMEGDEVVAVNGTLCEGAWRWARHLVGMNIGQWNMRFECVWKNFKHPEISEIWNIGFMAYVPPYLRLPMYAKLLAAFFIFLYPQWRIRTSIERIRNSDLVIGSSARWCACFYLVPRVARQGDLTVMERERESERAREEGREGGGAGRERERERYTKLRSWFNLIYPTLFRCIPPQWPFSHGWAGQDLEQVSKLVKESEGGTDVQPQLLGIFHDFPRLGYRWYMEVNGIFTEIDTVYIPIIPYVKIVKHTWT